MIPNPFRFVAAMVRTALARCLGYRILTTPAEEAARWDACRTCPHNDDDQCQICSCYLDAKVILTMEECPIGKWNRIWRKRWKSGTI